LCKGRATAGIEPVVSSTRKSGTNPRKIQFSKFRAPLFSQPGSERHHILHNPPRSSLTHARRPKTILWDRISPLHHL
jgi:hypothetical protein